MANYATLKDAIQQVIKQNGNNEITGAIMQSSLLSMIDALGGNYQYAGIATPTTNPGTPDQNVFYLASTAGTYINFGGIVLADGELAILKYNGTWYKDSTGAASLEMVGQLGQIIKTESGVYDDYYGQIITPYSGFICTDKMLYNKKVTQLAISPYETLFWKQDGTYMGYSTTKVVCDNSTNWASGYSEHNPNDAYYVAFMWVDSVQTEVDGSFYTAFALEKTLREVADEFDNNLQKVVDASVYKIQTELGTYNDSNGDVFPTTTTTRTPKIPYVEDFYISSPFYEVLFWSESVYQGYQKAVTTIKSPYSNTTHFALVFKTNVLTTVMYSPYETSKIRSGIDLDIMNESIKVHITQNEGYDETNPSNSYISGATGYCRTDRIPIIDGYDFDVTPVWYLFFDEDYVFIQQSHSMSDKPSNAIYVGVYWTSPQIGVYYKKIVQSVDDFIEQIIVGNTPLPKNGKNVILPLASTQGAGLMSQQDKIKLDTLQPNIEITGSGIAKNASSFGFLPNASASANNQAIANALNGGGTILVDLPGIYDISAPIKISSNTTLIFGANTFVRMRSNDYAVINVGAYTRTYDENIALIGLNLIANTHYPRLYDIYDNTQNDNIIYGLRGYINFFYVKNLYIADYQLLDQQTTGYGANICTFEDVVIERVCIKGGKDGLHFGRGKRLVVRDCKFACYDDACTMNAYDFSASQPEVGWIDGVLVENCYDMVHPNHLSAGFFSRFMGGAWKNWESGGEVMLGSTVVVEENGVKRMYRVAGNALERGYKFITTTKPTNTDVGTIEFLDEQTVTRTIGGVTETTTMKIPWVLQQTQDVGYDGGTRNITLRNIHLQKTRTFCIQYYQDNEWMNAIVPNALGVSVIENIVFDGISQEYADDIGGSYPALLYVNCPTNNIKILNSYIKHRVAVNYSKISDIAGLVYNEAIYTLGNNIFASPTPVYVASFGTIPNRVRMFGNILKDANATVQSDGTTFVTTDIV